MAITIPKKPPMSSARNELYRVPQIWGRTPNCDLFASQEEEVRNFRPCSPIAGTAFRPISHNIQNKSSTINTVQSLVKTRKPVSDQFSRRVWGDDMESSE